MAMKIPCDIDSPRLSRLLNPILPSEFYRDYWEKKPLFISRPENPSYQDILDERDLDQLLARNDLRFPTVKLVKGGESIPLSSYSKILKFGPYAAEGAIESDRVYQEFYKGATIICQLLEQSVDRTSVFIQGLAKEMGFRIDAHAFITPRASYGLSAHYDTASAFILQISGKKLWRLYAPVIELPCVDQVFKESQANSFVQTEDVILEEGGLLYVPRGVPHSPVAMDTHSIHLTVVLFPPTWLDIFARALSACSESADFRKSPRRDKDPNVPATQILLEKFRTAVQNEVEFAVRTGAE
jgi:ribosomal protein L16 Arg81 hydroxylase